MRFIILFSLIIYMAAAGCSIDPAEKLVRQAEKFQNAEISEKEFIEFFTTYFSKGTMPDGTYLFEDTAVYFPDENKVYLRLPWRCSITLDENVKDFTLNASESEKKFTLAHKKGFTLFSGSGSEIFKYELSAGEKKSSVRGAMPYKNGAVYYKDNMLYMYDHDSKTSSPLLKKKFKPVYEKFFDVRFHETEGILFMVSGSAGTYRISAYDTTENKFIVENIASASSRIYADKNSVMYISGATGDWSVTNFDFTSRKKRKIHAMTEIREIVLFSSGYAYQDSTGLFVSTYKNKPAKIPFAWRLAGKYRNLAVIKIDNRFVFADGEKFIEACGLISFLSR